MSYDLDLYLRENSGVSRKDLENYFSEKIAPLNEYNSWSYENEDTGVYFLFEKCGPDTDVERDLAVGFEFAGITFNINFIRPDFFGLEAFRFFDRLLADIDVYIINFQDDDERPPYRPAPGELYQQWSDHNVRARSALPKDVDLFYYPLETSNNLWKHNFTLAETQNELGDGYFVPSALFVKTPFNSQAASVTTWTQHIPMVLPQVDYVVLNREYKKFFRKVNDRGVMKYSTLMNVLGQYFEDFGDYGGRIIHPENSGKIGDVFNSLKFDYSLEDLCEALPLELINNTDPTTIRK